MLSRSYNSRPTTPAAQKDVSTHTENPRVFVWEQQRRVNHGMGAMLAGAGWDVETVRPGGDFLEAYRPDTDACLILQIHIPGAPDLALVRRLRETIPCLPCIVISDTDAIADAVRLMRAGAADVLEASGSLALLLASIGLALAQSRAARESGGERRDARDHLAHLTPRQWEIMTLVLTGAPSKNIAADLRISQRTVENHRHSIMHKTGCRSLPALARLAVAAQAARPLNEWAAAGTA
jgi:two-component system CheB/CheR fusion protein